MKPLKNEENQLQNTGENLGVMVSNNAGTINVNHQIVSPIVKAQSSIAKIIKILGSLNFEDKNEYNNPIPKDFKIENKIEYNDILEYKYIIEEYANYYYLADTTINTYDDSNLGSKNKIIRFVYTSYLKCKGKLISNKKKEDKNISDIDIIKDNSDFLIKEVINSIKQIIENSSDANKIDGEEITLGSDFLIVYCFLKCKILEEPA